jgi:hypothetical protein
MDAEKTVAARRYLRSFTGFVRDIDDRINQKYSFIPDEVITQLREEIDDAVSKLGNVIPPFREHALRRNLTFEPSPVRAYLRRVLASLETELEEVPRGEVVGPTLTFPFVVDANIRKIVERDYPELLTAFSASCKKACLILAGSLIEALLLDFALQNATAVHSLQSAPRQPDAHRWSLEELIDVAVAINPALAPAQTMSHTVRRYRNLVHPAAELRGNMRVELEEARVAISVVQIIHRELS